VRLPGDGREKKEAMMQAITVYRMDYVRKTKDPIGVVFEKRKTERAGNYYDLLRLARRLFAVDMADSVHITLDSREARRAIHLEPTRDIAAG
jgi:hypothetical protein